MEKVVTTFAPFGFECFAPTGELVGVIEATEHGNYKATPVVAAPAVIFGSMGACESYIMKAGGKR